MDGPGAKAKRGDLIAVVFNDNAPAWMLIAGFKPSSTIAGKVCVGTVTHVDRNGWVKIFRPFGTMLEIDPASVGTTRHIGDKTKCDVKGLMAVRKNLGAMASVFESIDKFCLFIKPFRVEPK